MAIKKDNKKEDIKKNSIVKAAKVDIKKPAREVKKTIPLPGENVVQKKERKIKLPSIGKGKAKEEKEFSALPDPYAILKFVLMTEKAVRMVEAQNKLVFVVDRRADKQLIKKAAESAFDSKISNVNTMIDQKGRKRAYIKFAKPGQAGDVAVRLGII